MSPAGNVPAVKVQVRGSKPPCASSAAEYASPPVASGSAVVVITRGSTTSIESACVSVAGCGAVSVTDTVKFALPAGPAGVPLITPAALRARPAGSVPALTLKLRVPLPPVAEMVWV